MVRGRGVPVGADTAGTHQIAHRAAPEARIVYVDVDPVAWCARAMAT
jgi:hypothetical protein